MSKKREKRIFLETIFRSFGSKNGLRPCAPLCAPAMPTLIICIENNKFMFCESAPLYAVQYFST